MSKPIIPSYVSKIPYQSLVKVYGMESQGVGYVETSSQYRTDVEPNVMEYHVTFRKSGTIHVNGENHMRLLTFWEFLWYRDPHTSGLKIGKNKALPLIYGEAVAIACTWAFFAYGFSDTWGMVLGWIAASFSVLLPMAIIGSTYNNWTKRWV